MNIDIDELISIIIPIYNNENLLKDSLGSAINQTYTNIEIIIINDGSPNKNLIHSIINHFNDKRVKLISLEKNLGISNALNYGINISKGTFISWLSHDDIYRKDKLEAQLKLMLSCNGKISYSNFFIFNEFKKKKIISNQLKEFNLQYKNILLNDNINGCTFLISKEIFNDIGLFDTNLKHIQDYDMWIRISLKYKIYFCSDFLVYSRVHSNQSSVLFSEESFNEKENFYYNMLIKLLGTKENKFFCIKYVFSLGYRKYLSKINVNRLINTKKLTNNRYYLILLISIFYIGFLKGIVRNLIKRYIKF